MAGAADGPPAPPASPRPGRKRSASARQAILDAALALLGENGYGRLTIEAIAARAGVGKQTIYRWWSSLGAILLDALRQRAEVAVAIPDTGAVERDVRRFLTSTFRALEDTHAAALRGLMAEAQGNPAFASELYTSFIAERRAALDSILRRGQERGELPARLDRELVIDLVYGTMWYRLLVGHAPLDTRLASALARAACAAASAGKP